MFAKKTSMSNLVESLWYIKCYCLSSPRPIKSPSNSIRYNCQICSWLRTPKNILEIRKRPHFSRNFKDFINHRKKTNKVFNGSFLILLKNGNRILVVKLRYFFPNKISQKKKFLMHWELFKFLVHHELENWKKKTPTQYTDKNITKAMFNKWI